MPLLHTLLATISSRQESDMPLLSEPWAIPNGASTRVVALRDDLSLGVADSTARAIFFLGPFALGALFWGSIAELVPDAKGALRLVGNARRGRLHGVEAAYGAAVLCSTVARGAGLATLSLLIAYTHGAKDIGCGSWLRALAAMAATTYCFSTAVFLARVLVVGAPTRLRPTRMLLGVFLFAAQTGPAIAGMAAWQGGLRPSGAACYARREPYAAISYLLPLVLLSILPLPLVIFGRHRPDSGMTASTVEAAAAVIPPRRSSRADAALDLAQLPERWQQLHLSGTRLAGSVRMPSSDATPHQREKSFLKLCDRSKAVEHHSDIVSTLRQCAGWWLVAALALLGGTVIEFAAFSPILSIAYLAIASATLPLCASRVAHSFPRCGPAERIASRLLATGPVRYLGSVEPPTADDGLTQRPHRSSLPRSSTSPAPGSISGTQTSGSHLDLRKTTGFAQRAGRLLHHMSGGSLRSQIIRATTAAAGPGTQQDSASVRSNTPPVVMIQAQSQSYTLAPPKSSKRISPMTRSSKSRSGGSGATDSSGVVDPELGSGRPSSLSAAVAAAGSASPDWLDLPPPPLPKSPPRERTAGLLWNAPARSRKTSQSPRGSQDSALRQATDPRSPDRPRAGSFPFRGAAATSATNPMLTPPIEVSGRGSILTRRRQVSDTRTETSGPSTDPASTTLSHRSVDSLRRAIDATPPTPPRREPAARDSRQSSVMEELIDVPTRSRGADELSDGGPYTSYESAAIEGRTTEHTVDPGSQADDEGDETDPAALEVLRQARAGESIDLSHSVDVDARPKWAVEREKELERKNKQWKPLEEVDEDELKSVLDERGFPRAAKGRRAPSREERFAAKLKERERQLAKRSRLDKLQDGDVPRQNPFLPPRAQGRGAPTEGSAGDNSHSGSDPRTSDTGVSLLGTGIGERGGVRGPSFDAESAARKVARIAADAASHKTSSTKDSSLSGGSQGTFGERAK